MSKPSTRQELIDYCFRRLGAPVLEINVDDDQVDDLVDDAIQYFNERHYDGVERTYLKYQITQDDVDRGKAGGSGGVGIVTTSTTSTIVGAATTFNFYENSNYISVPDSVIGIEKLFHFDNSFVTNSMFSLKYQLFLNDVSFNLGYNGILDFVMTKTYLQDIDHLLTTHKQIRFNKRIDRLYLDFDWSRAKKDEYIILDCYRATDPTNFSQVYNDSFVKLYLTALIKRQWGQNLIKFRGVKLPGGIELNGRELYEDAEREIESIKQRMTQDYELPPYDFIG